MNQMMRKRIVLINQATGYLFIDVANAFVSQYEEVILLAGDILPMQEPLHPSIKVAKISSYDRKSTLKRMLSWITALVNICWLLATRYRGADLLVVSNPPTASTIIPLLFKRKISLLIYDIYPNGLVAGGFVTEKNVLYKCWAWLNRKAYKKVHRIFTLTPGMAAAMTAYAPKEKIIVVPAWSSSAGPENSIAEIDNLFIRQHKLQGKFIVMYSGNLGKEYELESLVTLAASFRNNQQIAFIIMGKGWKKDMLEKMIAEKQLTNCMLLPYQPADLFVHCLEAFHVGVVSLAAAVAKVAIPSKTYNLLASHRPVFCIGSEDSDLALFLQTNDIGKAIDPGNTGAMKTYIERLYNDKIYYQQLCSNAALVSRNYTRARAKEIVALSN